MILHAAAILEEGVFGADGGVVEAGGNGIDGKGFAFVVLQEVGVEAVQHAFLAVGHAGGVVAHSGAAAEGFHAVDFAGVGEEAGENAHGVGAAADAGGDDVGDVAGHVVELLAGFDADHALEVAHHHGEGVGADDRADAVDLRDGVGHVGLEAGVHGFFEGFEAEGDGDDIRAEQLHAGDVGGLFGDVHFAHVDVTFQAKIGGGGGQGHAVLAGAGFGDEFFLAEVGGEESFAHAVVQFVGAGVVEVFALEVNLRGAEMAGEAFGMIDGGGASLEVFADGAQFRDEFG